MYVSIYLFTDNAFVSDVSVSDKFNASHSLIIMIAFPVSSSIHVPFTFLFSPFRSNYCPLISIPYLSPRSSYPSPSPLFLFFTFPSLFLFFLFRSTDGKNTIRRSLFFSSARTGSDRNLARKYGRLVNHFNFTTFFDWKCSVKISKWSQIYRKITSSSNIKSNWITLYSLL